MNETLEKAFKILSLPEDASLFLLDLYEAIQFFDDIQDHDTISNVSVMANKILVELPMNPFYRQNINLIYPLINIQILKWSAANQKEESGKADEKSYVWRAGYYDIVLLVYEIVFGIQKALKNSALILDIYGETYQEYKEEFKRA